MKGWLSMLFLASLSSSSLAAEAPAPTFTLKDMAGKEVTIKPGKEKTVIVLNFWASWCTSCAGEVPELLALKKAHSHAVFYGINQGENATKATRFKERAGYPYPILLDEKEEVGAKYQIDSLPQTIVIDATGKIAFRGPRPPAKL